MSLKERWLSVKNKNVWEAKRHFLGLGGPCGGSGWTLWLSGEQYTWRRIL